MGILAFTGVLAGVGLNSRIMDHRATFVTLRSVMCIGLVAVALALLARGAPRRLAMLLVVIAYTVAFAGLAQVNSPIPFTLGRLSAPVNVVMAAYFCLAYPTGRIEDRRVLAGLGAAAAVVVGLDLANVLLSATQPVAGPFVRCTGSACPANPFNVVSLGPPAGRALSDLLGLATSLTLVWLAIATGRRAIKATRLERRSLMPLFVWTILAALSYGSFVAARLLDERAPVLQPSAIVVAAIVAAMPLAIALAVAHGRLLAMRGLETMISGVGEHPSAAGLQRAMARAFADPTLKLLLWRPDRQAYIDADGGLLDIDGIEPGQALTEFARGDQKVAAVVHDPMLSEDRDVLEAAGRAVRLALEKAGLAQELSTAVAELEASRKRVAWAGDEERRRIEQDLHDGAQQQLIALRIRLEMLKGAADEGAAAVAGQIDTLGRQVDRAIEQIRALAKGIYPPILRDLGLPAALTAIARDMPLAVSVHAPVRRRFAPQVETAVYFCCVEALQNVAKHCGAGTAVSVRVAERPGAVHFTVADRGPGFTPSGVAATRGILGMRDRLQAIGGDLTVTSSPGAGTTVAGRAPDLAA